MSERIRSASEAAEVIDRACEAEAAIQQLCRATVGRPNMTPAEVDVVLAHLADAVAARPQAASQLADILGQAKDDHVLEMDTLTETQDPHLAIDTARFHLDAVRDPALDLNRLLDAAHQETAHIAVADRPAIHPERQVQDVMPLVRRPEDLQPPTASGGPGPVVPR